MIPPTRFDSLLTAYRNGKRCGRLDTAGRMVVPACYNPEQARRWCNGYAEERDRLGLQRRKPTVVTR